MSSKSDRKNGATTEGRDQRGRFAHGNAGKPVGARPRHIRRILNSPSQESRKMEQRTMAGLFDDLPDAPRPPGLVDTPRRAPRNVLFDDLPDAPKATKKKQQRARSPREPNRFEAAIARARQQQARDPKTMNRFEAAIARARQAQEQQAEPTTRGDIRDPLLQGLTFGLYDEAAGAVSGGLAAVRGEDFNEAYSQRTQQLRGDYEAYKERRPYAAMAGEFAGAVAPSLIPGLAAANAARVGGLGANALRGAGYGALGGGTYAFGQGEGGAGNRLQDAALGAATGGAVGGALPIAGAAVKSGVRAVGDLVAPNAASRAGINRSAQREINRNLAADDMSLQEVADTLRRYGSDATMADASPGLRETARSMVQFGSPGSAPLQALGRDRARQTATRISGAFDEVLGKRPAPADLVEALKRRTQRNADRNFQTARRAVADPENVPFSSAIRPALDEQRAVMARQRAPQAGLADSSFDFLSEAQKGISAEKRAAQKAAERGGGATAYREARVAAADEAEIVRALDGVTDGKYSVARSRYADDKQLEEAFDYGFGKAMSPGTEISFLRKEWERLPTPARIAARAGVRSWLGHKAGSVRGGRAAAREVLREGDARDKLKLIFGNDVTEKLVQAMEGQEAMWVTDDALQRATGSQTARMLSGRLNPRQADFPRGAMQALDQAAAYPARALIHAMMKPSRMTRSLGPALASQGSSRDALVQALLDSQRGFDGSRAIGSILRNSGAIGTQSAATTMSDGDLEDVLRLVVRSDRRRQAAAN